MDEVLAEHIKLTAEKGLSREEIRSLMINSGWPEQLVKEYIDKTFKQLEKGTIVSIHGVGKAFNGNPVLENVDFDVRSGEIFGIIGMSGAGKTTLLNVLIGFLQPDKGDVLYAFNNQTISVFKNSEAVKRQVGFSTQTPSFYSRLTVRENLEHFASLYGIQEPDRTRRVTALLELVGLKDAKNAVAAHLSGGMQKRLDIACAILHDPNVLILDEPTADLDPILRKQFWELIKKINAKGTTIILASHFLAEIELLCSRIAILQNRKIVEIGTADELRDIYSRNYEIYLRTAAGDYDKLLKELSQRRRFFAKVYKDGNELVVETPKPEHILATIANYVERQREQMVSLHVARPSLGKVFEHVVSR